MGFMGPEGETVMAVAKTLLKLPQLGLVGANRGYLLFWRRVSVWNNRLFLLLVAAAGLGVGMCEVSRTTGW